MAKRVAVSAQDSSTVVGALLAPVALTFTSIGRLIERALEALTEDDVLAIIARDDGTFEIYDGVDAGADWDQLLIASNWAGNVTSTKPAGNTKAYEFVFAEQQGIAIGEPLNPDTGTEQTLKDFLNRFFDGKWDDIILGAAGGWSNATERAIVIDQSNGLLSVVDSGALAAFEALGPFTNGVLAGTVSESGSKWE